MSNNTRVCLAVFDMVGTTVESGDEVPTSFRAALTTVGVALTDEAVTGIRGRSKRDAIAELIATHVPAGAGDAHLVDTVYARFQKVLRAEYRTRARAVPGAQEVLLHLKNAGVQVVLNTGLDGETARLLVEGVGWQHLDRDHRPRARPCPVVPRPLLRRAGPAVRGRLRSRCEHHGGSLGPGSAQRHVPDCPCGGEAGGMRRGQADVTRGGIHQADVGGPVGAGPGVGAKDAGGSGEGDPGSRSGWMGDGDPDIGDGLVAMSEGLPAEGVVRVPGRAAGRVVDVLSDAFRDYPVMRFVVGEAGEDYGRRLERLVGLFVGARALRDEPLLAVAGGEGLAAAAIMSFPDDSESPAALAVLREEVWTDLGADARARYDACGDAWRPLGVDIPHVHLNMIGVRSAFRGRGYGRLLLEHVHAMARETPGAKGVTLTTEDPRNVPLYRAMGYEVVGHARVAPDLETWGFFRPS